MDGEEEREGEGEDEKRIPLRKFLDPRLRGGQGREGKA